MMQFSAPTYDHMSGRIKTMAYTPKAKEICAKLNPIVNFLYQFQVELSAKNNYLTILGTNINFIKNVINMI